MRVNLLASIEALLGKASVFWSLVGLPLCEHLPRFSPRFLTRQQETPPLCCDCRGLEMRIQLTI